MSRPTWPISMIIGVESWKAVWTPTAAWQAPGPRVTMQMPGSAGQLAIGLGHVGGAGLVARVDQLEAVAHVEQRIQHFQIALARHAEGHVGAVDQQLIDQDFSAGARIGKGQVHRVGLQESGSARMMDRNGTRRW